MKTVALKTLFLLSVSAAHRISEIGAFFIRKGLSAFHREKVVFGIIYNVLDQD